MTAPRYAEEVRFARSFTTAAAGHIRTVLRSGIRVNDKPDATPVTNADLEVNHTFIDRVRREFPRDGVSARRPATRRPTPEPGSSTPWTAPSNSSSVYRPS